MNIQLHLSDGKRIDKLYILARNESDTEGYERFRFLTKEDAENYRKYFDKAYLTFQDKYDLKIKEIEPILKEGDTLIYPLHSNFKGE